MNCEKCKNKKATVFFADEGGRQHALCSLCGERQKRLGGVAFSPNTEIEDKAERFIPDHTLTTLAATDALFCISRSFNTKNLTCRGGGTSIESAIKDGRLGCVDCYEAFAKALPCSVQKSTGGERIRMPSARRARLQKEGELKRLKESLKKAVGEENFELALTLRDKIRAIENT